MKRTSAVSVTSPESRFHVKKPASSVAQMLAPPPVTLYSPEAASNSRLPVLGVIPRSPLTSNRLPCGGWAAARAAAQKRTKLLISEVYLHRELHGPVPAGRGNHTEGSR